MVYSRKNISTTNIVIHSKALWDMYSFFASGIIDYYLSLLAELYHFIIILIGNVLSLALGLKSVIYKEVADYNTIITQFYYYQ